MSHATIETVAPVRPTSPWSMPDGLSADEAIAYRKGYASGTRAYVKANGTSAISHNGPSPVPGSAAHKMLARQLAGTMVADLEARHPKSHAAGMRALRSWITKRHPDPVARLADIVDPMATVKPAARKPRAVKPAAPAAPVAVETPAPVPAPVPAVVAASDELTRAGAIGAAYFVAHESDETPADFIAGRRARKAGRRELAGMLRADGLEPSGLVWAAATTTAGLVSLETVR